MWFFRSPQIYFGEDAVSQLEQIEGQRAFIVADPAVVELGFARQVQSRLETAGMVSQVYSQVETEPSVASIEHCAHELAEYMPDWIIGLGGGSAMDTAKGAWLLYECPDVDLQSVNPLDQYGLRSKARFVTIPTTAGSGSEVTHAVILSDPIRRNKLEQASYELIPDLTIVDPQFSASMPRQLTIDTGLDALSHAVEGYNTKWSNDYTDGLCLQVVRLVFEYLTRAVEKGAQDRLARAKMANAATIAGMVIPYSNISLAHAMGHSAGAIFQLPHGRVTAIFLPVTIEYAANAGFGRYLHIARVLGYCVDDESLAARQFAAGIRELYDQIGQSRSLAAAGITRVQFEAELEALCDGAEIEPSLAMPPRIPERQDLIRLFEYAFEGKPVDF